MRTAMSAGALALVLGSGIPAVSSVDTARADTVTQVDDCDHGGLLGTVTGGICRTVDNVVSGITGDTSPLAPLLAPLSSSPAGDDTAGTTARTPAAEKTSPIGEETPAPATSAAETRPAKETPSGNGPRPEDPTGTCRPTAASPKCPDPSESPLSQEAARPKPSPSPSRDHGHRPARKEPVPVPTGRTRQPSRSPYPEADTPTIDVDAPVTSEPSPVVDAEAPRVELLWPAPLMQELQRQMSNERPVTPSRSSDTAGTVLTTAVLILAILAVRLLYSRRKVKESIPFEPVPPGHHRVA
ncbi:hypothetical protein ABZ260_21520 [Streptosporangium sp. NPDC006013]|uniref:hypothetical protein n=1 Tax=Streptosporangium sp. NPDC006013 TaxID=3155596 RepID=UPI0033A47A05